MLRKLFTALAPLALGLAFAAPTAAQAADQVVRVGYQKKYGAFTLLKGRGTLEKKTGSARLESQLDRIPRRPAIAGSAQRGRG